jgi:hypothetical protein
VRRWGGRGCNQPRLEEVELALSVVDTVGQPLYPRTLTVPNHVLMQFGIGSSRIL